MEFQKFSNFHIHKKECVHWFSINIALLDVRNPQDVDKCNANWATVPKLTLQFYRLSTQLSGWCSEIPWGAQQLNISSWRWVRIIVMSVVVCFKHFPFRWCYFFLLGCEQRRRVQVAEGWEGELKVFWNFHPSLLQTCLYISASGDVPWQIHFVRGRGGLQSDCSWCGHQAGWWSLAVPGDYCCDNSYSKWQWWHKWCCCR